MPAHTPADVDAQAFACGPRGDELQQSALSVVCDTSFWVAGKQ